MLKEVKHLGGKFRRVSGDATEFGILIEKVKREQKVVKFLLPFDLRRAV